MKIREKISNRRRWSHRQRANRRERVVTVREIEKLFSRFYVISRDYGVAICRKGDEGMSMADYRVGGYPHVEAAVMDLLW